MKGFRTTLAVAFTAGALALAGGAAHAQIVKWVDEKGVTHYGEKAPDGAKATKVKVSDTTSSDADAEIERLNKNREAAKAAKNPEQGEKTGTTTLAPPPKEVQEANNKACEQHRNNLASLKSGKRVRLLDAQGKPRSLTAEEVQAQIDFAEGELKRCEQMQKLPGSGAAPAAAKP